MVYKLIYLSYLLERVLQYSYCWCVEHPFNFPLSAPAYIVIYNVISAYLIVW